MTDLIQRLHREAERRGVATMLPVGDGCFGVALVYRQPNDIAMDVADKIVAGTLKGLCDGNSTTWLARNEDNQLLIVGTFIKAVVRLAEADHG
jgi:hypothetical protein